MRVSLKEIITKEGHGKGLAFLKGSKIYTGLRYFFIWIFLNLGLTANQVTFFWFILGLISLVLFAIGNYWSIVAGAILFYLAVYLDDTDGAVARMGNSSSRKGEYIDCLAHSLHFSFFFIALGIGLFHLHNKIYLLYIGIFAAVIFISNAYIKESLFKAYFKESTKTKMKIWNKKKYNDWTPIVELRNKSFIHKIRFNLYEIIKFNGSLFILIFIAFLNLTQYYLLFYAIVLPLILLRNVYNIKRILEDI